MSYTGMMQCLYDQLLPNDTNEDFFKTLYVGFTVLNKAIGVEAEYNGITYI